MNRRALFGRTLLALAVTAFVVAAPARAADLDKYLPDGAQYILSFNIKQLLSAPIVKSDQKAFDEAMQNATKAMKDFGIDPMKDLDKVIFASSEDPQHALIFLEGKFEVAKIEAELEKLAKDQKDKLKVTTEGKAKVFQAELPAAQVPVPGFPSTIFMTSLSEKYFVMAFEKDALKEALDKKAGSKKAEVKKEVLELIAKINPAETLSVVLIPPAAAAAGGGPAAEMTHITGGITVKDGVDTNLLLSTKNADAAKGLAEMISQGLQQAKAFLPALAGQGMDQKQIDIVKYLMETVKASAEGSGVTIKSTVSKEYIQKNSKKDS